MYYRNTELFANWMRTRIADAKMYPTGSQIRRYHLRIALSYYHLSKGRQQQANLCNQSAELLDP